ARESEIEDAGEILDVRGNVTFFENSIQRTRESAGAGIKLRLELGTLFFEVLEDRFDGGERQRMTHERAREKRNTSGRKRLVAELPCTAIESIHKRGFTREHTDRHAA